LYPRVRFKTDLITVLGVLLVVFGLGGCIATLYGYMALLPRLEAWDVSVEVEPIQERLIHGADALEAGTAPLEDASASLSQAAAAVSLAGEKLDVRIPYFTRDLITFQWVEKTLRPFADASEEFRSLGRELENLSIQMNASHANLRSLSGELRQLSGDLATAGAEMEEKSENAKRSLHRYLRIALLWSFILHALLLLLGLVILRLHSMATFKYS
jgi:hypothetical protein